MDNHNITIVDQPCPVPVEFLRRFLPSISNKLTVVAVLLLHRQDCLVRFVTGYRIGTFEKVDSERLRSRQKMGSFCNLNPARIERTTLRILQTGISRATTVPRVRKILVG